MLEGIVEAGFVNSNHDSRLISKVLKKGDVFVFPVGLTHFQRNVGYGNAVSVASLSSQSPGLVTASGAVLESNPHVPADILSKAFQLDKSIVEHLQTVF